MKIFGTESREIFYVAQENIDPSADDGIDLITGLRRQPSFSKLIRNKLLGEYYEGFDPLVGEYLPKRKYQFMFPDPRPSSDTSADLSAASPLSSTVDEEGVVQEALIKIYQAFRGPLLQSHEEAKTSSVYVLPSNDFLQRFGGFYPSTNGLTSLLFLSHIFLTPPSSLVFRFIFLGLRDISFSQCLFPRPLRLSIVTDVSSSKLRFAS
jgi:hypothetical protein